MKAYQVLFFSTVINCLTLLSPEQHAYAADRWKNVTINETITAVTPKNELTLKIIKPKNGVWGHFLIPLQAGQAEKLKKYRFNIHFPFIPTYITIDKIERRSTGKVNHHENVVSIDIDARQWDGLKKGETLAIELPDGTLFKEKLRGSKDAMRALEKTIYH